MTQMSSPIITGMLVYDETPRPTGVSAKRWNALRKPKLIRTEFLDKELMGRVPADLPGTHVIMPHGDEALTFVKGLQWSSDLNDIAV